MIVDAGELWDTAIALKALGPYLAERLEADFAGWDYHLMVANASGTWGNAACDKRCVEGDPCNVFPPYPCDYQPDVCDQTLGAGVTYAAGGGSANAPCAIDGDQRYVVSGQQDLAGVLECLIVVGAGGHMVDYPVARATLDAIDAPLNTQGACNGGFLRDDAYLVLFVLSTLPDFHAEGTPEEWATELKAHKSGKFDKIYFTGLFGGCSSPFGWKEYEPLNEWVSSLYHHTLDDACTGELVPYVDPALDYVLDDCQE